MTKLEPNLFNITTQQIVCGYIILLGPARVKIKVYAYILFQRENMGEETHGRGNTDTG